MGSQIDSELSELATLIAVDESFQKNGWLVEFWEFSSEARTLLIDTYRKAIVPADETEVEELRALGIPVDVLLYQEDDDGTELQRTTRADITEIAAAASIVAREGVSLPSIILANLPKKSRKQSEPGIDVMAVFPDLSNEGRAFGQSDEVILCSVKHTEKSNMAGLRWNLEHSIEEMLELRYLARQLRTLHGALRFRGIDAWEIMKLLTDEHTHGAGRIKVVGVAAADATHRKALKGQMDRLKDCSPAPRTCRNMLISGLPSMHEAIP